MHVWLYDAVHQDRWVVITEAGRQAPRVVQRFHGPESYRYLPSALVLRSALLSLSKDARVSKDGP
jgi:hypothetical protein